MRYRNPVISGFYPDPSVCEANGKYYLATSSFEYFPGVPVFESDDLINWRQIGHAITRHSQADLAAVPASGGIWAPTLRYHQGRFYMVTTNFTTRQTFFVYTDDIYGEWSEPVFVEFGGDPSLMFENDKAYLLFGGTDDMGNGGIIQCEIDIETGHRLTPKRSIWKGTGGRYLEAPHMYHIGNWYYLFAAEGGTAYGHMEICARSASPWGPFISCPHNPILTNRDKAPYIIQGIGHGDMIRHTNGQWYMLSLGFRQSGIWDQFHHLGREVFLTPAYFDSNGWPYLKNNGTTEEYYEAQTDVPQSFQAEYTFKNTNPTLDWCYLRAADSACYDLSGDRWLLYSGRYTLDDVASPTFIALRQKEFNMVLQVQATNMGGEGGITVYSTEQEHYDIYIRKNTLGKHEAVLKLNLSGIRSEQAVIPLQNNSAQFIIRANGAMYEFFLLQNNTETFLGRAATKYLSNEVSSPYTGAMLGLFAQKEGSTCFENFRLTYTRD